MKGSEDYADRCAREKLEKLVSALEKEWHGPTRMRLRLQIQQLHEMLEHRHTEAAKAEKESEER